MAETMTSELQRVKDPHTSTSHCVSDLVRIASVIVLCDSAENLLAGNRHNTFVVAVSNHGVALARTFTGLDKDGGISSHTGMSALVRGHLPVCP